MNARLMLMAAGALLLAACDEGRVTLSVADAPIDSADAVVIQFSRVVFIGEEDVREVIQLSPPAQIDLLQLTGGKSQELLSSRSLPAGNYERIELRVDGTATTVESYVDLPTGARVPLFVPQTARSGLSVAVDIDVDENSEISLTADFDLRSSLRESSDGSAFELHPKIRIVLDDETGIVSGGVAAGLITSGCMPAVYVYSGSDATPDDIGGTGTQPISSARVTVDGSGAFGYAIGFLEAGNYTLALTCQAGEDDPAENDTIVFVRSRNVTVQAGRTASAPIN